MQVYNRLDEFVTIEIMLANGSLDSVNIQPRGRVTLPPGAKINPDKAKLYASYTKVKDEAPAPTKTESETDTEQTSTPSSDAKGNETSGKGSGSVTQSAKR